MIIEIEQIRQDLNKQIRKKSIQRRVGREMIKQARINSKKEVTNHDELNKGVIQERIPDLG